MTHLIFYAYQRLQQLSQYKIILWDCLHFQLHVVYQFWEAESARLEYLQHNQVSSSVADYTSFCEQSKDPENTENKISAVQSDCLYIITIIWLNGNRYLRQNIHNCIFTINEAGFLSNFLTKISSLQGLNIRNGLLPGQSVIDRTDLAARVFESDNQLFCFSLVMKKYSKNEKPMFEISSFKSKDLGMHLAVLMNLTSKANFSSPTSIDTIICVKIYGIRNS